MNFEKFQETIMSNVRAVGAKFTDPADDWYPFFFFELPDAKGIEPYMLPPDATQSLEGKNEAATQLLPELIRKYRARSFAVLASAWAAHLNEEEREIMERTQQVPRPSTRPDRREMLFLLFANKRSSLVRVADIVRFANRPPALGMFRSSGDMEVISRFDAAISVLRELNPR